MNGRGGWHDTALALSEIDAGSFVAVSLMCCRSVHYQ